jgi:hypothetical protein
VATSTPRGYPHSRSVLTLYDGCLWQCSLHGRRLGFCLRGGSGLLSGRCGFLFRHYCGGFIPIPGQVRRFPAEYTIGCQLSTIIKPNVLLGKDLHLQARPDYRHGWGAEDADDVDQSSLGRCLLLRLNSRLLFSSSGGWFSAPFTTGGWRVSCATSSSMVGAGLRQPPAGPPTISQSPSSPFSTGPEGGISCKQWSFIVSTLHRDTRTRLPYSRKLTS